MHYFNNKKTIDSNITIYAAAKDKRMERLLENYCISIQCSRRAKEMIT